MTQLIIALLLLLLAVIVALFYEAIRWAAIFPKASLIIIVILVSSSVVYYKHFEKQHRLSFVPEGIRVEKILYAKEESWGFGPGGNETGVIVYELPDTIARQISKDGINYFSSLPPQSTDSHDWHGRYEKWYDTPIPYSDSWSGPESDNKTNPDKFVAKIETYLNRYGFSIPIDPNTEAEIDYAISEKGSFFAYSRIGLIIVSPKTRRVVYAYNG
nr:hypothetical protein [uncultured Methylotenera sp.]